MESITFRPIAFLLKLLANNFTSNNKEDNTVISVNKNLSLLEVISVINKSQQKSIGFFISKVGFFNFKNKISNNILVGKDKSVVAIYNLFGPTPYSL